MSISRYGRMVLISFLAGIMSVSALAERKGVELGLGASQFLFGDDTGLEDDVGWKANLGYRFGSPWGIELSHNDVTAGIENTSLELDVTHTYFDVLYHLNSGGKVEPYFALGYGNADAELVDGDTFDVGFGLKFYLSDHAILRPDIHYADVDEFADPHMIASLTFSLLLGGSSSAPKKIVVASEPEPDDTDKDGVQDSMDECPATPMGVGVDARGCPLDSDGDGVYDFQDKCPDTAARLKVDAQGCPVVLKDSVSINIKVNFDSNSDVVRAEYLPEIRRVAEFLEQYANTVVVIEGHTDTSGSAQYNKSLSQRRANAVARVLVDQLGISARRVSAVGYGEEQPIADESTREGMLANRRVVAEISTEVEKLQEL